MYIPAPFRVEDCERLAQFMVQHSFATVISHDDAGRPFASHLPVLYEAIPNEPGRLCGHLARANPQSQHLESNQELLVIFQGPHAYISPHWYATSPAVPTWNYAVVHAYGIPTLFTDGPRLEALVRRMTSVYEATVNPGTSYEMTPDFMDRQLKGIVGFEIRLTKLQGKFKLGQNRSLTDRQGVGKALAESPDPTNQHLARLMKDSGLLD